MAEQDFVTIPTSVNAPIAADDLSGAGTGPFVQQMSLINIAAELRELVNILGKTFGESNDAGGRIRVLIDSITTALTLTTITTVSTVTTVTTCSTVTNAAKLTGLGSAATDASVVPYDINAQAWNQYRNNVVVS